MNFLILLIARFFGGIPSHNQLSEYLYMLLGILVVAGVWWGTWNYERGKMIKCASQCTLNIERRTGYDAAWTDRYEGWNSDVDVTGVSKNLFTHIFFFEPENEINIFTHLIKHFSYRNVQKLISILRTYHFDHLFK